MHATKKVKTAADQNDVIWNMNDDRFRRKYDLICDDGRVYISATEPHCAESWKTAFVAARDEPMGPNMKAIAHLRSMIWVQTEYYIARTIAAEPAFLSNVHTEVVTSANLQRKYFAARCVEVVEDDMLEVARRLVRQGKTVAVLNMANAQNPGGGVRSGKGAQEENLHRRTDAFRFLEQQPKNYPIPPDACLVSPGVTVLRGAEADGYPFRPPFRITLISCAAVRNPRLTEVLDYAYHTERRSMERKIAVIMKAAAQARCDSIVLSAFGCGAFGNPPEIVARIFKQEFNYTPVENIIFSIIDDHNTRRWHNPRGNLTPFTKTFCRE